MTSGPNRVVERPHVIYNSSTQQYVMYMHIDNSSYSERRAGVATSSSVCGSYTYRGSSKPLGHDSLDDNLFVDGGTGYFMSEDRTNAKLQIYQLSSDFLSVAALVKTLPQYEAPAMAKINGTYFVFGSHLTGWSTNDNQYATASSITGSWVVLPELRAVRHQHLQLADDVDPPSRAPPRPVTSSWATGGTRATSPTPATCGSR